jgi:hypothetical protein
MATRNFVPRADNEGGIGTALKRWAAGCIVKITANNVIISDGAGNYMQLPKLTTAERDALSAVNGMVIYNTTTLSLEAYENGAWGSMGVGENNTASNVGTAGVGIFKQKTGVDLEFKKINAGSSKITITDDVGDDEVDIDVVVAEILTASSVTATAIAAFAVTTAKIAATAVSAAKIAPNAITATKIAASAVTTAKIAATAVTAAKIAPDAVTTTKITASAVTTAKINTSAVTTAKIAASAITTTLINATAVTAAKIAPNAVTTTKIAASAVTTAKINTSAVTTAKIAASAITTTLINATAVTAAKIGTSAVTTTKIAASAVTTAKINTAAVTYAKIQNVSATDKLLGRSSGGAGVVEEIPCTAAGRAILDDADAAAQRATLGAGESTITAESFSTDVAHATTDADAGKAFTIASFPTHAQIKKIRIRADFTAGQQSNTGSALINDGTGVAPADTSIAYDGDSPTDLFAVDDQILIDSERMDVTGVDTGTNTLTVTKGIKGTMAAYHDDNVVITKGNHGIRVVLFKDSSKKYSERIIELSSMMTYKGVTDAAISANDDYFGLTADIQNLGNGDFLVIEDTAEEICKVQNVNHDVASATYDYTIFVQDDLAAHDITKDVKKLIIFDLDVPYSSGAGTLYGTVFVDEKIAATVNVKIEIETDSYT